MDTEIYTELVAIASRKTGPEKDEDWCVYDWCGGNVDDAYSLGMDDGEIFFARYLLSKLQAESKSE